MALEAILGLSARTVLELGPGCYRFARVATEAGLEVTAVELPISRAAGLRPPPVATWFTWHPERLPWADNHFDVCYQQNMIPNLPSRSILAVLAEATRVSRILVWSGDLRPRFWEDGRALGGERAEWMRARLEELFEVECRPGKILILRRRHEPIGAQRIGGQDCAGVGGRGVGGATSDSGHAGGATCRQAFASVRGEDRLRQRPSSNFGPACAARHTFVPTPQSPSR